MGSSWIWQWLVALITFKACSSPSLLSVPPARQGRAEGLQAISRLSASNLGVGRWCCRVAAAHRSLSRARPLRQGSFCSRARPRRLRPWGPLVTSQSPGRAAERSSLRGPRVPMAVTASMRCWPLEQSPPRSTPP